MPTALAAKGIETNGPQQPFPAAPAAGPPDMPIVTPWALAPHHGHTPPAQLLGHRSLRLPKPCRTTQAMHLLAIPLAARAPLPPLRFQRPQRREVPKCMAQQIFHHEQG